MEQIGHGQEFPEKKLDELNTKHLTVVSRMSKVGSLFLLWGTKPTLFYVIHGWFFSQVSFTGISWWIGTKNLFSWQKIYVW